MSSTREIAASWFDAMTSGDVERAVSYLSDDVEWINYTPVEGYNTAMPWIGTCHGPTEVIDSFKVFTSVADVGREELRVLVVDGEHAMGVVYEQSTVKETGRTFEIEFVQALTVRDGQIVRWKSYTDPSEILRALSQD